jgi:glycosyltransferase involved in cell wall biosynthesis
LGKQYRERIEMAQDGRAEGVSERNRGEPRPAEGYLEKQTRIEIGVPTRNRPSCLLLLLQSLRQQTCTNWDLTVIDDNDEALLLDDIVFRRLLWLVEQEGHRWRVVRGIRSGPQHAHNIVLVSADHDLVLRIDDDLVPQPTFIECLLSTFLHFGQMQAVGAVGGVFPLPHSSRLADHEMTDEVRSATADYGPFEAVSQRHLHPGGKPWLVHSLYSSFLYDRHAVEQSGGFPISFSRRGEKEETDTTVRLVFRGKSVIVAPQAVAWHLEAPSGGVRLPADELQRYLHKDAALFNERLKALARGGFDWEAERRLNLSPFEGFRDLRHRPCGFYGYP